MPELKGYDIGKVKKKKTLVLTCTSEANVRDTMICEAGQVCVNGCKNALSSQSEALELSSHVSLHLPSATLAVQLTPQAMVG